MTHRPTTVFLHVGCRKSGTSALQHGFRKALERLRVEGLDQPLVGHGQVLRGLDDDPVRAERVLAELATRIRESPHPRHLLSLEALAEWDTEATSLVVAALAEFDTRLVVTARPWAVTIPSEWQQRIKARFTGPYDDYVRAIVDPGQAEGSLAAEAADFRRRQDLPDVVRRWRAAAPDLPAHVVLVPTERQVQPGLLELFCDVVGIEPRLLRIKRGLNESLNHEDAEALRLVNLALGTRLADPRGDYRRGVRRWIALDTMTDRAGTRIRLPARVESWASEQTARQLEALRAVGCDVRGDPVAFVSPELPGEDFVPATDAAVARAAAASLAELATKHAAEPKGQPPRGATGPRRLRSRLDRRA